MDEKTILLFDDYLQGALSANDRIALESQLENDSRLQDAFTIFKDLNEHLAHTFSQERKHVKESIQQSSEAYFEEVATLKKDVKVIRLKPLRYLVAASMVMLFGVIFWLQMQEASYEDYAPNGNIDLVERSGDESAFAKAEQRFNKRDYRNAILFFNNILETDPNNAQVLYYKGIALVEIDEYEEGQKVFQELVQGNSVFKNKAQWYIGLSLLKQDRIQECKLILQMLPETAEDYEQAQELLKKLD